MPLPMQANTNATARNTAGSASSRGGPDGLSSAPKKMRSPPADFTVTGTLWTNTMSAPSASGVNFSSSILLRSAHRKPRPMPRKLPNKTMLEK